MAWSGIGASTAKGLMGAPKWFDVVAAFIDACETDSIGCDSIGCAAALGVAGSIDIMACQVRV